MEIIPKKLFHHLRTTRTHRRGIWEEEILPEEITAAVKQMKDGKAPRLDEISTELLKLLDDEQLNTL